MSLGIFGDSASPMPDGTPSLETAAKTEATRDNPPDELNYSGAEFRLANPVGYDTRTGYAEQFPEQEDLSIFGWTNYPDPRVGFGADTAPVAVPTGRGVSPATTAKRLVALAGVGLVGAGIAYTLAAKTQPGTRKLVAAGGGVAAIGAVWWMVASSGMTA